MNLSTYHDGAMTIVGITGDLTIYQAAELKAQLQAALGIDGTWGLDLSKVSKIDTAGLQVLLALRRAVAARRQELPLVATSAAVQGLLATYRMTDALGAPPARESLARSLSPRRPEPTLQDLLERPADLSALPAPRRSQPRRSGAPR